MKITHLDKYKFQEAAVLNWSSNLASLKVLYFITGTFNFKEQRCFPHNQEQIAVGTSLSVISVKRSISSLKDDGWIKVKSDKGRCNKYSIEWNRGDKKVSGMIPGRYHSGQEQVSGLIPSRYHSGEKYVSPTDTHTYEGTPDSTYDSKTYDSLMKGESGSNSSNSNSSKPNSFHMKDFNSSGSIATDDPSVDQISYQDHRDSVDSNIHKGTDSSLHDDGSSYWEKRFHKNQGGSSGTVSDNNSLRTVSNNNSFRTDNVTSDEVEKLIAAGNEAAALLQNHRH